MTKKRLTYDRWEVWLNGKILKAFKATEPPLRQITNIVKEHGVGDGKKYEIIVRVKNESHFWRLIT